MTGHSMDNHPPESFSSVKAILFDVFGTVVDWESGITRQLQKHAESRDARLSRVDWLTFARDWRKGFWAAAATFPRNQDIEDFNIDDVHRRCLEELIPKYALEDVWTEADIHEITQFWHYLKGWPDSSPALHRLREHYIMSPCANGTLRLLIDMAIHADLPWHAIFTSDVVHAFKPAPRFYLRAARLLRLQPREILMVAAHAYDLAAARALGFRTCYVRRGTEDGGGGGVVVGQGGVEWLVDGIDEIADGLSGARG